MMLEIIIVVIVAILEVVAPVLVGILSVPLAELLKKILDWFKRQPEWVMLVAMPIAALGLTYLSKWVGAELPGDLWMWDHATIATVLSAAIAYATYVLKRLVGMERQLKARGYLKE